MEEVGQGRKWRSAAGVVLASLCLVGPGCRTASQWRKEADRKAEEQLSKAQETVRGKAEPMRVETPADTLRRRLLLDQHLQTTGKASLGIRDLEDQGPWKTAEQLREGETYDARWNSAEPVNISLNDAILIAARNSREYQAQKDSLFQVALALDLEDHNFQESFSGKLNGNGSSADSGYGRDTGFVQHATAGVTKTFKNGLELAASLTVDLAKMLTGDKDSSWGVSGDASVSIPLLRGSGEFIVTEGLTQAQRNLVYAIRDFEQYKRSFMVNIATSYLNVLQARQKIKNQEESYKRVVLSTRRSRRMADAGLLPENQFDQAVQDVLSARDNWISTRQSYQTSLDSFKILLGLPPDAKLEPLNEELDKLLMSGETLGGEADFADFSQGVVPPADAPVELKEPTNAGAGPSEINEDKAIRLALDSRPDLKNYQDKIWDAQRAVLIAQDALRAELTLGASAAMGESRSLGSASLPNGRMRPKRTTFGLPIQLDLPWERTRERNAYRNSLISLEKAVRTFQAQEDNVKKDIRSNLRSLMEKRSSVVIQRMAVKLAERRVDSTNLLLQAGRAEIRDVLEAQNALLSAQNSLISALVSYRLNELAMQRDLGVLTVSVDGVWTEADLQEYK